jgi:hypothetical protein
MSTFWPEGIELRDTQPPREILKTAQDDWQKNSDGVMGLVLQDAESESGNPMIIVHAEHIPSNRTATLFSIVHRPGCPYPATIQPQEENLPQFLKKTYLKPGENNPLTRQTALVNEALFRDTLALKSARVEPLMITNQWVSDTPAEFREKLAKAFNLGIIKSTVLNLVSSSTENEHVTSKIPIEESEES